MIILVSVVSLRFKCRKNKESEGTCVDLRVPLCPSLLRNPELDSRTDTQLGVEGRNGTSAPLDKVGGPTWVGFDGQVGLLSYSM